MMETDYQNLIRCISQDLQCETHVQFRMCDLKVVKDEIARLNMDRLDALKMQRYFASERDEYRDANYRMSEEITELLQENNRLAKRLEELLKRGR